MTEPWLVPLSFGVAASAATLFGGALALRFSHRITLILALTAGVVLGVAFFDLIPEALELGGAAYGPRLIMVCAALGFGLYILLDRSLGSAKSTHIQWRAHLAPAGLTLHSFLDGLGIGLAFQVSPDIGWMVALAVLTHDIADGVNTVSLSLAGSERATAMRWLVANGMAPLLGVTAGLFVRVPPELLAPLLGGFAGVFLYIGACELVPRAHAQDPRMVTTIASLTGMLLIFVMTELAK